MDMELHMGNSLFDLMKECLHGSERNASIKLHTSCHSRKLATRPLFYKSCRWCLSTMSLSD